MRLEPRGRDHAGRDRGAGATRADGDNRTILGQVVQKLAHDPVRHVSGAVDVALVPLGLLTHVEHFDVALREEPVELIELDRLELLARLGLGEVAAELEETDRAQPTRGLLRVLGRGGVDRHRLVCGEHERGLRRERRARERDVERAGDMAGDELSSRPDVENRAPVRRVGGRDRRQRADERPTVELDDPIHVRRARRGRVGPLLDELLLTDVQRVVEAALEADRRGGLRAHAGAAERAGDVAGEELDAVR